MGWLLFFKSPLGRMVSMFIAVALAVTLVYQTGQKQGRDKLQDRIESSRALAVDEIEEIRRDVENSDLVGRAARWLRPGSDR